MPFQDAFNFCEKIVRDLILASPETDGLEADRLEDLYCLTLNGMPPRYVRHEADTVFYLTPDERADLEQRAVESMRKALQKVRNG